VADGNVWSELEAAAGDGVQGGSVGCGGCHRVDGSERPARRGRELDGEGLAGVGIDRSGIAKLGGLLGQEHADAVIGDGRGACANGGCLCGTECGKQQKDAGEMAGAETHRRTVILDD
jgi:hypothetical protein